MMSIYATVIGTIAGICLGYAILYFFVGLRRGEERRLNLSFALFALGYGGALIGGFLASSIGFNAINWMAVAAVGAALLLLFVTLWPAERKRRQVAVSEN